MGAEGRNICVCVSVCVYLYMYIYIYIYIYAYMYIYETPKDVVEAFNMGAEGKNI
jgi:hypothetical protein